MSDSMDNLHRPRPRRGGLRSRPWLILLLVALIAGIVAAAGTFAVWNQTSAWPQAQFMSSGNLTIEANGDPVWRETSPDVTTAPRLIDPEEFMIRSGDSIAVDFPFKTTLAGENMRGRLRVDWDADTRIPEAVFARYSVLDERGTELISAPTVLGGETVFDLTSLDDGADTASYIVRVHLDLAGLDDRFGEDSVDQLADLGDFMIELNQARPGDETR